MKRILFALTVMLSTSAHAGVIGVARLDLHAAQKCACEVSNLPCPPTMPEIVFASEWSKPSKEECCGEDGRSSGQDRRFEYSARSYLEISHIKNTRTITLYQSAGFEQAVHEFAADAFVQNGGNKWDVNAREHVGYQAEWAAKDCKR